MIAKDGVPSGALAPHVSPTNDARAADTLDWPRMGMDGRAACCLAALIGGFALDCEMRFNPRSRIAYALVPNPNKPDASLVSMTVASSMEETLKQISARFGLAKHEEVVVLLNPKPRWRAPWRKR